MTLPDLHAVADQSDFAIVVRTADDLTTKRGQTNPVPRDNVLFELGFFMGRLGVERTYMVSNRDNPRPFPAISPGSPRPPLRNVRTGISLRQSVRHPRRSGKPCRG